MTARMLFLFVKPRLSFLFFDGSCPNARDKLSSVVSQWPDHKRCHSGGAVGAFKDLWLQ